MEKCPKCDRELGWPFSYPLVRVNGFERLDLPVNVKGVRIAHGLRKGGKIARFF